MTTPRRFQNGEQEERARNLAASAPLTRRPIDDELDALGWTQRYDGDDDASELTDEALGQMFDPDGRLNDRFLTIEAVRERYLRLCRRMDEAQKLRDYKLRSELAYEALALEDILNEHEVGRRRRGAS